METEQCSVDAFIEIVIKMVNSQEWDSLLPSAILSHCAYVAVRDELNQSREGGIADLGNTSVEDNPQFIDSPSRPSICVQELAFRHLTTRLSSSTGLNQVKLYAFHPRHPLLFQPSSLFSLYVYPFLLLEKG